MNKTYDKIAEQVGISQSFMWSLVNHPKKRPSWETAKKLARITRTTPELWLDAPKDEIRRTLGMKQNKKKTTE